MKKIRIDCTELATAQQLHIRIAEALSFPHWYGCNLDALHDQLVSIPEETTMILDPFSVLPFPTGGFRRVFQDSCAENSLLTIILL